MIHYHGSPSSGPRDVQQRFYARRHIMVSYAYPDHLSAVADVAQTFAIDNGAYTTWRSGKAFDFEGYLSWVCKWCRHPGFDWCIAPDVIDGGEQANDKLLYAFLTRFGRKEMVVPVWHFHESIGRLRQLCGAFPRVALGSSGQWPTPGTDSWWGRVAEFMPAILCDGQPICKLHGLRMLNVDVFTRIPLASADSANAAVNGGASGRFGMYAPAEAWQRSNVIADRIEAFNSSAIWQQSQMQMDLFELV